MDIDRHMESLIEVAGRLITIMTQELDVLHAMHPAELERLREEKDRLTAAYEEQYRTLAQNRDAIELVSPAIRQEFETVARRFSATLAENGRVLAAAKTAHERVLRAVVEAVKESQGAQRGYSGSGERNAPMGEGGTAPVSLSLDQRL